MQHNRERQRETGTERRDIPLGPCLVWSQLYALSDSIDSDHEAAAAEPAAFGGVGGSPWGRTMLSSRPLERVSAQTGLAIITNNYFW